MVRQQPRELALVPREERLRRGAERARRPRVHVAEHHVRRPPRRGRAARENDARREGEEEEEEGEDRETKKRHFLGKRKIYGFLDHHQYRLL